MFASGARPFGDKRKVTDEAFVDNVLSRPEFLHKERSVVKNTICEKVRNLQNNVETDYVKHGCISTGVVNCGKLLWKSLWRMWKTSSFQQVFGLLRPVGTAVEKSAYGFA